MNEWKIKFIKMININLNKYGTLPLSENSYLYKNREGIIIFYSVKLNFQNTLDFD